MFWSSVFLSSTCCWCLVILTNSEGKSCILRLVPLSVLRSYPQASSSSVWTVTSTSLISTEMSRQTQKQSAQHVSFRTNLWGKLFSSPLLHIMIFLQNATRVYSVLKAVWNTSDSHQLLVLPQLAVSLLNGKDTWQQIDQRPRQNDSDLKCEDLLPTQVLWVTAGTYRFGLGCVLL